MRLSKIKHYQGISNWKASLLALCAMLGITMLLICVLAWIVMQMDVPEDLLYTLTQGIKFISVLLGAGYLSIKSGSHLLSALVAGIYTSLGICAYSFSMGEWPSFWGCIFELALTLLSGLLLSVFLQSVLNLWRKKKA